MKTILHIIESDGGTVKFLEDLIFNSQDLKHIVIHSDRTFRIIDTSRYGPNVALYHWESAQREVKLFKDIRAFFTLYRLIKKLKFDVVHIHSSKAGFLGRIACFFLGVENVIYTPHGLSFARTDISAAQKLLFVLLEKLAARLSGKVVCCSYSEAELLKQNGVSCSYINNGTEITSLPENNHSTHKTKIQIVTTGRITFQKNPMLFNRIAQYFEDNPSIEFIWIGEGELRNELTAKNITITGWQSSAFISEVLSHRPIYISTALWEGLPFAVLEAMNLACPLILSACIGNVDLVINGESGYLYNDFEEAIDKIKRLIQEPDLRESFGLKSRQYCMSNFNVNDTVNQYYNYYKKNKIN